MTLLSTTSSINIDVFEVRSSKKLAKTTGKNFLNSVPLVGTNLYPYIILHIRELLFFPFPTIGLMIYLVNAAYYHTTIAP